MKCKKEFLFCMYVIIIIFMVFFLFFLFFNIFCFYSQNVYYFIHGQYIILYGLCVYIHMYQNTNMYVCIYLCMYVCTQQNTFYDVSLFNHIISRGFFFCGTAWICFMDTCQCFFFSFFFIFFILKVFGCHKFLLPQNLSSFYIVLRFFLPFF